MSFIMKHLSQSPSFSKFSLQLGRGVPKFIHLGKRFHEALFLEDKDANLVWTERPKEVVRTKVAASARAKKKSSDISV